MVYTAAHLSLAVLEMLVQDQPLRANYLAIPAQIPDGVAIKRLTVKELPRDWRQPSGVTELQVLGNNWLAAKETAVLEVPSAVLPQESLYLLNPNHSDFRRIVIGTPIVIDVESRFKIGGASAAGT